MCTPAAGVGVGVGVGVGAGVGVGDGEAVGLGVGVGVGVAFTTLVLPIAVRKSLMLVGSDTFGSEGSIEIEAANWCVAAVVQVTLHAGDVRDAATLWSRLTLFVPCVPAGDFEQADGTVRFHVTSASTGLSGPLLWTVAPIVTLNGSPTAACDGAFSCAAFTFRSALSVGAGVAVGVGVGAGVPIGVGVGVASTIVVLPIAVRKSLMLVGSEMFGSEGSIEIEAANEWLPVVLQVTLHAGDVREIAMLWSVLTLFVPCVPAGDFEQADGTVRFQVISASTGLSGPLLCIVAPSVMLNGAPTIA